MIDPMAKSSTVAASGAGGTWAAISEHLPPILSVAVSN
jgi:hypothetical protein